MEFPSYCKTWTTKPRYLAETLRIMRLMAILLFAACLHVSARGYTQGKVTLSEKEAPLQKVFKDIQKKTNFYFVYYEDMLSQAKSVTFDVQDASLEDVLKLCFKDQPLTYYIVANSIVVKQKARDAENPPSPSEQAPGVVEGKILNENGEPLTGATITVNGTHISISTNDQGEFKLTGIDPHATLTITHIGYEKTEVKLNGRTSISLQLNVSVTSLVDVVVNKGYYNTTKTLNTGDVTTVSGADIQKQPVTDPILALEGRVPGLNIQQTSGVPGAYSSILLRGQNSIGNGNDPLYIIDGVPFNSVSLTSQTWGGGAVGTPGSSVSNSNEYNGKPGQGMSPFNALNPADIESIEVLKDADATAIYGSRGANGVILITTRKGKAGQTQVDANVYSGSGKVTRTISMLNTPEYLKIRHEGFANDGVIPTSSDYDVNGVWDSTRYTNWQKVLIGNAAPFTNAQVNVSGGVTNTQFVIGGGYSNQGTVFPGSFNDKKASGHININHESTNQRFHIQLSSSYVNDNSNLPYVDLTGQIGLAPDAPALYDADGNLNWQVLNGAGTWNNPFSYKLVKTKAITTNFINSLNLSYKLLPGLELKSSFGYTLLQMNSNILHPAIAYAPPNNNNSSDRSNLSSTGGFSTWIVEPQASYRRRIGRGHLELLLGSSFQQKTQNSLSQYATGFSSDALLSNPLAASTIGLISNSNTLYHYNAAFGRIAYNWEEKYVLNITARRDGSSRFGPGKQFGSFGAIGAAWVFTREKLIKDNLPFLNTGKIRASYGTSGNDQIPDYQYLSNYTPYSSTYQGLSGLYPSNLPNPYFAWELIKKEEVGLELDFLKNRISFIGNYYRNRDNNQLVGYSLPNLAGFTSVEANLPAVVQNTGLEFAVHTVNMRSRSFTWTTDFNLTAPWNKLISYPNIANSPYKYYYAVGHSLYSRFLYHSTGVDPTTGLYTFATKNANGLPTYGTDYFVSKPITQHFYGGFLNSFSYKGFQLDLFIQFVNQTGYSIMHTSLASAGTQGNNATLVLARWQKPGDITNIERASAGYTSTLNTARSDYASYSDGPLSDASFIRLKNLALSYQLPASWQKSAHLQNARLYLQCQNLLTFTKYQGLDPETQGLTLPPLRMITAGIQVTL